MSFIFNKCKSNENPFNEDTKTMRCSSLKKNYLLVAPLNIFNFTEYKKEKAIV